MPAAFAITELYDLTAPTGTHIQELVHKAEVKPVTVENLSGVTVKATTEKMISKVVTMKIKGAAALSDVAGGAITKGVFKLVSLKTTEKHKDYVESELTYETYDDVEAA